MTTQPELPGLELRNVGVRSEVYKAMLEDIDDLRAADRLDARGEAYAALALAAAENLGRAYGRGASAAMLLSEARATLDRLHEVAKPDPSQDAIDERPDVILVAHAG